RSSAVFLRKTAPCTMSNALREFLIRSKNRHAPIGEPPLFWISASPRAEHCYRLNLHQQLGTAKDCLDAGRRWQGVKSQIFVERGTLLIERLIIAFDIAEITGGANHVMPSAAFAGQ